MKSFITIILIFIVGFHFSQGEMTPKIVWAGKLKDASSGLKLSDVSIVISRSGEKLSSYQSLSGKYKTEEFDAGFVYTVKFSKSGYLSKSILINSKKGYFEEYFEAVTKLETDIDLLEEMQLCKSEIFPEIVGRAFVRPETGELAWDLDFAEARKIEIEKIRSEMEESTNRYNKVLNLYNEGNYEEAEHLSVLLVGSPLKTSILDKLNEDIANGISKGINAQYQKLLAKADKYLADGDLAKSEVLFKRALSMNPEDSYPSEKLIIIENKRNLELVDNTELNANTEPVDSTAVVRQSTEPNQLVHSSSGSVNATMLYSNRRVYRGDDMLAQKERYMDYLRTLNSRKRPYRGSSYVTYNRSREYVQIEIVASHKERNHKTNTHLQSVNQIGQQTQESRSNRQ